MYMYLHNGPMFYNKVYTDLHWQWEPYQLSTAKLEHSFGAIFHQLQIYMIGKKYSR